MITKIRKIVKGLLKPKRRSLNYVFSNGLKLRIVPEAVFAFDYFEHDNAMKLELNAFLGESIDKICLFDVGALYGLFSMAFLKINQNAKVVSFEPSMKCKSVIEANKVLSDSKRWLLEEVAVGRHSQTVFMHYEWNHLVVTPNNQNNRSSHIPIKVVSIDEWCLENLQWPDIMKIDVEGYELDVLLGAKKTILVYKPTIFLELHGDWIEKYGGSIDEVIDYFKEIKYGLFDLSGNVIIDAYNECNKMGCRVIAKPLLSGSESYSS